MKIVVFGNISGLESLENIMAKQQLIQVQNFRCTHLSSVDHPAVILYTSGTTGLPKGALHSHKSLFGNIKLTFDLSDEPNIALWYATLCWVSGILCTFSSIWRGVTRVIAGPFVEDNCFEIIEKFKVNYF